MGVRDTLADWTNWDIAARHLACALDVLHKREDPDDQVGWLGEGTAPPLSASGRSS